MKFVIRTILSVAALLSFATLAQASIHTFEANLDGLQEVPPDASPAFGLGQATLDDVSGAFTIVSGSYQDLLGSATAVTVNDAGPGANGPLLFSLTLDTPGASTGTYSGNGVLTAGQVTDMLAGNTYVDIRSQVFPSGEIRGQWIQVPEPGTLVLAAIAGLGLLTAARRRVTVKSPR